MAVWFWYILLYGFLGYLLEKSFAYATKSSRRVRKCFLLLPVCPVYGLAMAAVLLLVPPERGFLSLAITGGLVCTGVEYLVHWFYDRFFSTRFWDYSQMHSHIRGRVCPQFTFAWGLLSAAAVRWIHPGLSRLAAGIPASVTYGVWLLTVLDCVLTAALLLQYHDTELLTLRAAAAQVRASSQSSTSR